VRKESATKSVIGIPTAYPCIRHGTELPSVNWSMRRIVTRAVAKVDEQFAFELFGCEELIDFRLKPLVSSASQFRLRTQESTLQISFVRLGMIRRFFGQGAETAFAGELRIGLWTRRPRRGYVS
jgi:hypothetical protein